MLRSEVEVLSRDPDRGNPTLTRQGRGPELTGRSQCGQVWRCGASVRAGLKEAVDASWWRTKVKRRKACVVGKPALSGEARNCIWNHARIGDGLVAKSVAADPGRSVGFRASGSP